MSRAYQIRVSTSLTHHSKVGDGIEARLEVLPILAPERTAAILAEVLADKGYAVDEDGRATKEVDGVSVAVDTTTGTVRLTIEAEEEVELEATRTQRTYEERATEDEKRLEALAQAELKAKAKRLDEDKRAELSDTLERVLTELTPELSEISDAVNRIALKERATQLGRVLEVAENAESGELTIRVEV